MAIKAKVLIFLLLVIPILLPVKQATAEKPVAKSSNTQVTQIEAKKIDKQAEILSSYLAEFDSPLQYHAQDFIDASNTYKLDWKLLPAIAGVESTFGKQIPGGFNAWGWGVYGTQAIYFNSWRDGIFTIAKGLRENYLDKGFTDPYSINRIYAASPYWGGRVSYFMQDLENFAAKFEAEKQQAAQVGQSPNIAAISGQLALR
ncbi:MAG: hypothetical protein M1142_02220 [Patescibacteria group bacterium]|nr:hypothetical protein [Patescibacteria group bacterium]